MIDLLLSYAVPWIVSSAGLAMPAIGAAGTLVGAVFGGWKKWVVMLIGLMAIALWVMGLKLTIARQETKIAVLQPQLDQCQTENAGNEAALTQLRLDSARAIAAITADRDRIARQKERVRVVKEKIVEHAAACPAVPDAVVDWLGFMRGAPAEADRPDRASAPANPGRAPALPRPATRP